jgi:hypothetical protein
MPLVNIETSTMIDPAMKMYQDRRFSLGNATSFAPSMIGSTKLPNTAGIDGMRNSHTMITPCSVNARL